MAHGVQAGNSPLLALAAKEGMEAIIPLAGVDRGVLMSLAGQIAPQPGCLCRILTSKRDKGGEFVMFSYRRPGEPDFSADEIATLSRVARLLDRCFVALAQAQEQEFEAGLFRLVGNLHPEGLCVLDNKLRIMFENRKFKEQMQAWNGGLQALQSLSLPRQSELPRVWRDACERCFQAYREIKFPPVSSRMVVTQGPQSSLRHALGGDNWFEGAVRFMAFQTPLGVRPYLILTCSLQRRQSSGAVSLKQIAAKLRFSRRETELAELILRGNSAREIAAELRIALPTVKTHIRHILHKSGVKTRLQFVGLCRPQG